MHTEASASAVANIHLAKVQQTLITPSVAGIKDLSECAEDETEAQGYFIYLEQLHFTYDRKSHGDRATAYLFEQLNEEGERLLHLGIVPPDIRRAKPVAHRDPPPLSSDDEEDDIIDPAAAATAFNSTGATGTSAFRRILKKGYAAMHRGGAATAAVFVPPPKPVSGFRP